MKLGVISDVHGNYVALRAVLEDMEGEVDKLICAGDVVGYGPQQTEVVTEMMERDVPTVQGNHDRSFDSPERYQANNMAYEGLKYARACMTDEQKNWVYALPMRRRFAEGKILLKHEHPDDDYIGTLKSYVKPAQFPEMNPYMRELDVDMLIMGHTHVQHVYEGPDGTVLNPGSVGQTRDKDNRAAYAIVDTDTMDVELRRVEYDIEKVIRLVKQAGLPVRTGTRLR